MSSAAQLKKKKEDRKKKQQEELKQKQQEQVSKDLESLEKEIVLRTQLSSGQRGALTRSARKAAGEDSADAIALLREIRDSLPPKPPHDSDDSSSSSESSKSSDTSSVSDASSDDHAEAEEKRRDNAAEARRKQLERQSQEYIGTPEKPCIAGDLYTVAFDQPITDDDIFVQAFKKMMSEERRKNHDRNFFKQFNKAGDGKVPKSLIGVEQGTKEHRLTARRFLVELVALYMGHIVWEDEKGNPTSDLDIVGESGLTPREEYIDSVKRTLSRTPKSKVAHLVRSIAVDHRKESIKAKATMAGKKVAPDDDVASFAATRRKPSGPKCYFCHKRGHKVANCWKAQQSEQAKAQQGDQQRTKVDPKKSRTGKAGKKTG